MNRCNQIMKGLCRVSWNAYRRYGGAIFFVSVGSVINRRIGIKYRIEGEARQAFLGCGLLEITVAYRVEHPRFSLTVDVHNAISTTFQQKSTNKHSISYIIDLFDAKS